MRLLIYFLIAFLLSWSVYAKPLQGDSVNGVAASENFMKQGDAEIVFSGVRKVFTNQENPTSCGTHGNTDKVEFKRTKSKLTGGDYNWEITKHEGDMTGYGIAYDFSITENLNKSRVPMKISFDVMSESGNLTFGKDSEVKIYVIPSNEEYIEIAGGRDILGPRSERTFVPNATIGNTFSLCFLVRTNRVSPFIFSLDNIKVSVAGPSSRGDVNNTFTAIIDGTVSPSTIVESTGPYKDWIAPCTRSATGRFSCPIKGYNNKLSCTGSRVSPSATAAGASPVYDYANSTKSNLLFYTNDGTGAAYNAIFSISCTRTGSDYIKGAELADQYAGMDIKFSGTKPANQSLTLDVTNISFTAREDSTGSWDGTAYRIPSDGDYRFDITLYNSGNPIFELYVNGVKTNLVLGGSNPSGGGRTAGSTYLLGAKAGQLVTIRASATVTITGSVANSLFIYKVNSSQALFRPDTFYPADVVTSEVQVGWDRTVTPNKPIYKRCHLVASDVTTSGTVLTTWSANLKPRGALKYSATSWALLNIVGTTTTSNVNIVYVEGTGAITAGIAGTFLVGAGTTICMEYTKP